MKEGRLKQAEYRFFTHTSGFPEAVISVFYTRISIRKEEGDTQNTGLGLIFSLQGDAIPQGTTLGGVSGFYTQNYPYPRFTRGSRYQRPRESIQCTSVHKSGETLLDLPCYYTRWDRGFTQRPVVFSHTSFTED